MIGAVDRVIAPTKKKFLLTLALTGLTVLSAAQLPPPTPAIAGEKKQDVGGIESPESTNTHNSSQNTPRLVNQSTATPTQTNAHNKATPSSQSSSINWGKINTILLTIFSAVLVVVGYFQWKSMDKQSAYMRQALGI